MPHAIKVPVKSRVALALIVIAVQISFILSMILRFKNHQDCTRFVFRNDAGNVPHYNDDDTWSGMIAKDDKQFDVSHDNGWNGEHWRGHLVSNLETEKVPLTDEFAWNSNPHETIDVDDSCVVWQWICDIFT